MDKLFESAFKAIGSVFAPGMMGVFIKSLFLTLFALVAFVVVATFASDFIADYAQDQRIAMWLRVLGSMGAIFIALFLFPGIMPIFVNFFDSTIATLIERKSYPAAAPINPPFWPEFWHDARFSLMAVLLNILILPLLFLAPVYFIVFYALNGHLLGKEFFVMVARRYVPLNEALLLRKSYSGIIFVGGVVLTVFATIPFVNLAAPFWGIALMTHLYHLLARTPKVDVLPPV